MDLSAAMQAAALGHLLKVSTWAQPAAIYLALHTATTINAAADAADPSIDLDDAPSEGGELVLNPGEATEETRYAGAVSGAGPYTVVLLDVDGVAAPLTNAHAAGELVSYRPGEDGATVREPAAGSYARTQYEVWSAPVELSRGIWQSSNTNEIELPQATGAAFGTVTHILGYSAAAGGDLLFIAELDEPQAVVEDYIMRLAAGELKVRAQTPSDTLAQQMLKHLLKIATWTQATNLYVGLHTATALSANADAAAGSISVSNLISEGAAIVINPGKATAESFTAGTITGAGPYVVELLDSEGAATTLANAHTANEAVSFEPAPDGTDLREPSAASYGAIQHNAWSAPAVDTFERHVSNNVGVIQFAKATGEAWGTATHVVIRDSLVGGNLLMAGAFASDAVHGIVINSTPRIVTETFNVYLG